MQTLEREIETRVEAMGFEFVELERAGSRTRPILRVRIDRPGAEPGNGVTLDDCATVSRGLEAYLDGHPEIADRYVLEVSSPGVERPLVRRQDYERFAGRAIAVLGREPIHGGSKRVTGELLGLGPADEVRLRLESGEVIDIPVAAVARAHSIFRWRA